LHNYERFLKSGEVFVNKPSLYNSFRLRQLTGIPLTRICEVAYEIAYETLLERPDLLQETIRKYSVRSPERELEIDLARGDLRVVD